MKRDLFEFGLDWLAGMCIVLAGLFLVMYVVTKW